ncbi:MAG: hypothetical protein H6747_01470 [Deltaproteobacteria bacterium]|nr:hypothetical protein [Deltaproteobacteria bacterium]
MTDARSTLDAALQASHPLVWIGPPPPSPSGPLCLRVDAGHAGPIGPLGRLRDEALAALGSDRALLELAAVHLRDNLRRRLLAGAPSTDALRDLVPLLNRLHEATPGGVAVVLDHVDRAGPTTLDALRRLLDAEGWLRPPLVLGFDVEPDGEAGRALIAAVVGRYGASRRIDATAAGVSDDSARSPDEAAPTTTPPTAASAADLAPAQADDLLAGLDPDALRVLRGAAVVGERFEPELVAALLATDAIAVLEALQRAADRGLRLDADDTTFALGASLRERLLDGLLPQLRRAWDHRLAELLHTPAAPLPATPSAEAAPVDTAPAVAALDAAGPEEAEPVGATPADAVPADAAPVEAAPVEAAPIEAATVAPAPPNARDAEQAHRAALHMLRAGRPDLAAERFLAAAEIAGQLGANAAAVELAEDAVRSLRRVPATGRYRALHLHAALARTRLLWRAAGTIRGVDLDHALEAAEEISAALGEIDPLPLRAEAAALVGGICFDIGDRPHLDRALDALTEASRLYERGGEPLAAAALLNDQAAVWVRLGDPVRANWLLERSREVFARRAGHDASARRELAETELGIARLPLHVAARPGQAQAAAERALQLCESAHDHFDALGDARSAARADVVAGRLLLRAGQTDEALARLARSSERAARAGDLLGVGDAAAAAAEALLRAARQDDALDALERAVQAHRGAGSSHGLDRDRELLTAFANDASLPEQAASRVQNLRRML